MINIFSLLRRNKSAFLSQVILFVFKWINTYNCFTPWHLQNDYSNDYRWILFFLNVFFSTHLSILQGLIFFIGSSTAQTPVNCSTGCWVGIASCLTLFYPHLQASRGECFWEEPTDPGLEPYWPWACQHGEQGVDTEVCYCGRCWGCKPVRGDIVQNIWTRAYIFARQDTAACPNGKCSLRSPGENFKPNGEFCNEYEIFLRNWYNWKKNSETRIVNVGRKWIPIRVKVWLTRDALMTLHWRGL